MENKIQTEDKTQSDLHSRVGSNGSKKPDPKMKKILLAGILLATVLVGIFVVFISRASAIVPITPYTSFYWPIGVNDPSTTALDSEKNPRKVYDVDLENTPVSTISTLKSKGIIVVCYFSAGTAENFRSDYSKFLTTDMGNNVSGWAGEKWLDTRSSNVRSIMQSRLDNAVSKGCNGVEPDNVDGYQNNPGFPLTQATQLDYLDFLATEAHSRNLNIGLKNAVDLVPATVANGTKIVDLFDWALNEECYAYNECGNYTQFIAKNKGVFIVEYSGSDANFLANICPKANASNYDAYLMNLALDGKKRVACRTGADIVSTNIPPTVNVTSPVDNSSFISPANVTLTASAADSDGTISKVEFYSGGKLLGSSTSSPYTFAYNSLAAGSYSINAIAYDDKGASTTSSPVTFTVADPVLTDTQAPVGPTGLSASAISSSSISLSWTAATDNIGVSQYLIFRGGVQVGSTASLSYVDNNLAASTGYSYQVKAKDSAGNTSTGSNIIITTTLAATADTIAPSTPGGFKVALAKDSTSKTYYNNLTWTASTDNVGIKDYIITRNGTVIGTTSLLKFRDYGFTQGVSTVYEVQARDLAGNLSANAKYTVIVNCSLSRCSIKVL